MAQPQSRPEPRPRSPAFDRNYGRPEVRLPAGACDTHFHIIGPQSEYPLKPGHLFSDYDFDDATLDDWVAMQAALGFSRGVHIQTQMYGHSYELLLHAQCRFPDRLRTVAIPRPGITDRELEVLTGAGFVGARFSFRIFDTIDETMVHRTHEHGWAMHYLPGPGLDGAHWRRQILASPGRFVLEHMGNPRVGQGIDSEDFRFVLECIDTGRCWVKMSPRISAQPTFPFSDVDAFHRKLVEYAPQRLLWGTDWPHPIYFNPMPNDADLLDLILRWVPDEATRHRILVDNPAELFGFPAVSQPVPPAAISMPAVL
jgi:predicted TIM-barrel fold metal-dependent hydrolase